MTPGHSLLPVLKPPFGFGGAVVERLGSATDELVSEADASGFGILSSSSCCAAEAAADAALLDDDVATSDCLVKKLVMS